MNRLCSLAVGVAVAALALGAGVAAAGDVNINIGAPAPAVVVAPPTPTVVVAPPVAAVVVAPPPIIVERPRMILVPETKVYTTPHVDFNLFLFGGKYYSHHNDHWFVTTKPGAPWTQVVVASVPVEVRGVPVKYYKVPPGHAKKHKDKDDDDDRGHGRGGKGCPPGLAKQGRC
jgi:hypothetical protein